MYAFLADVLVVLHLMFVAFIMTGGFLLRRWPTLIWLHLPAVLWGAFIEFSGGICPLTPLENQLRTHAGETGYSGGFVEHYLLPIQWLLGGCVVVVNLLAYGLVYRDWARRRP